MSIQERRPIRAFTWLALCVTALGLYYLSPVRFSIPWKTVVVFDSGFQGPVRVVSDKRCPKNYARHGLTYTIRLSNSNQTTVGRAILDRSYSHGKYEGSSSLLNRRLGATTIGFQWLGVGASGYGRATTRGPEEAILIHWGFVGTAAQLQQIGGAQGVERYFERLPLPPCAER